MKYKYVLLGYQIYSHIYFKKVIVNNQRCSLNTISNFIYILSVNISLSC